METKARVGAAILLALVACGCGEKEDPDAARLAGIGEAHIATDEQYAYVLDKLENGQGEQRAIAAWALGQIARPRAVPALIGALEDEEFHLRLNACTALAHYGGEEVGAALVRALGDTEEQVVAAALRGLSRPQFSGAAESIGEVMESGNETLRPLAVKALSEMASLENRAVFERLAGDADPDVRSVAAFTLGRLGDSGAIPTLVGLLEDEAWAVRANAAQALGTIGDPAATPHLENLPKDPDQHQQVRLAAELALEKLSKP